MIDTELSETNDKVSILNRFKCWIEPTAVLVVQIIFMYFQCSTHIEQHIDVFWNVMQLHLFCMSPQF